MKLRTQFIITMLLFGIILFVIAASAIITDQLVEKAGEQEKIASNIAQGASELSYLSNDYLIYRESQQLKRWQSRFASFSAQVASLRADRPEQQALVRNIQANQKRLKEVFDSVASGLGTSSRESERQLLTRRFFRSHGAEWRSKARGWYRMLPACRSCSIRRWTGSQKQEPCLCMSWWVCLVYFS